MNVEPSRASSHLRWVDCLELSMSKLDSVGGTLGGWNLHIYRAHRTKRTFMLVLYSQSNFEFARSASDDVSQCRCLESAFSVPDDTFSLRECRVPLGEVARPAFFTGFDM